MSFVFEKPRSSVSDTFAGGMGSIGEIYGAAVDQMLYVDNTFATNWALDRAIMERNDEVFRDTGVRLELPFGRQRAGPSGWRPDAPDALAKWQDQIAEAAARIPDQNVAARLNRSIEGDAIRIARESDERLSSLMASRGGAGKWVAAFAGGMAGSMRDPIAVGSLLIGGGPGAARTVTGRIVATAAREAFINGATEAAMQPLVQAWRKKAGLDNGIAEAMKNVSFAAAFGGVLGGAGQTIGEIGGKLAGRALEAAGDAAAVDGRVAEPLRRAMDGDIAAARQTLPEVRAALPAEARGALDQAEILDHLDETRPASVSPEHHDVTVSAAHRAIDASEPPAFTVDPDQVQRIVNDMVGDSPSPDAPRARSLSGFLIDAGGVQDYQGELRAIGATSVSEQFRGRLVRDGGMTLDQAREAAEEAGYIGRAAETQVSTVADLLDALDADLRGNHVLSRADQAQLGAATDFEAQRAGLERTVAEIAGHAGPGVDDMLIRQAAKLSIEDGLEPFDALERVLISGDFASLYHGTPFEFREFDLGRSGTASGSKTERAVFFSPDPAEASNFGLSARGEPDTAFVRNHTVDLRGFDVVDMKGARARHTAIREALDRARDNDRPGVIFRNMDDRSIAQEFDGAPIHDQVAVLDTSRISRATSVQRISRDRYFGDEPMPGWSDAELEAASAARGQEPEAGFFPDPAKVDPEFEISPAEIEQFAELGIPGEDGRIVTLEAYIDDISHGDELAAIVKACRA